MCINIIMAVSLNLITGFTGQFSLGHAGFMAIGAYVCALVIMELNTPFAFIIGIFCRRLFCRHRRLSHWLLPTLRLKGDYLAIATLGLAEIIRIIIINLDITNGAAGLFVYQRYTTWVWIFGFTVATILVVVKLYPFFLWPCLYSLFVKTKLPLRPWGINTTKYKIIAFTLSSFLAGIGGALYASSFYMIQPTNFGFMKSIDFLIIVVLGGMGSISGSVIAAMLFGRNQFFLQDFAELRMIIYSALLIFIMLFRPQGLLGTKGIIVPNAYRPYWKGLRSGKKQKGKGIRRWHHGIINS